MKILGRLFDRYDDFPTPLFSWDRGRASQIHSSRISKSNRPKGCYYRKSKLWYNTLGKPLTSKARKAICCEK